MLDSQPAAPRAHRHHPEPTPPALDAESARVLDSAVRLFWRDGYRRTTTRDIERLAGVSLSRIYCLFGCKERLLASALLRYAELLNRELVAPLEASTGGLSAVVAFFLRLRQWVTHEGRPGCMLVNLMAERGTPTRCIGDATSGLHTRLRGALEAALVRAEVAGECCPGLAAARAEVLTTAVLGVNLAARGGASDAELQGLIGGIIGQVRSWSDR